MKMLGGIGLFCLAVILVLWATANRVDKDGNIQSVAGHEQRAAGNNTAAGRPEAAQNETQSLSDSRAKEAAQAQFAQARPAAVVEMTEDFRFEPTPVTIKVGDTVRWINKARVDHTVTADPKLAKYPANVNLPRDAEPFDSGYIRPGDSFRHSFTVPGRYRYTCTVHEAAQMVGEVEVLPAERSK